MSYSSVEAALLTVIRLMSGYTTTNTSAGDYRILNASSGKSVILTPGAVVAREVVAAPRRMRTVWGINIELAIPFRGDVSTVATAVRTDRQALIDHVDKYPTLNSAAGVLTALIIGADEPGEWEGVGGGFWIQRMIMHAEERSTITIAE